MPTDMALDDPLKVVQANAQAELERTVAETATAATAEQKLAVAAKGAAVT